MKRGQEVYIIVKGTVIKCVVVGREQETQTILLRYQKGEITKNYKRPIGQVALCIEGRKDGRKGSSLCGDGEGDRRCDKLPGKVRNIRPANIGGKKTGNNVFKGVWAL